MVISLILVKDTHRKNITSNKTQALEKDMNMDIWINGTINQLLIRASYNQFLFSIN